MSPPAHAPQKHQNPLKSAAQFIWQIVTMAGPEKHGSQAHLSTKAQRPPTALNNVGAETINPMGDTDLKENRQKQTNEEKPQGQPNFLTQDGLKPVLAEISTISRRPTGHLPEISGILKPQKGHLPEVSAILKPQKGHLAVWGPKPSNAPKSPAKGNEPSDLKLKHSPPPSKAPTPNITGPHTVFPKRAARGDNREDLTREKTATAIWGKGDEGAQAILGLIDIVTVGQAMGAQGQGLGQEASDINLWGANKNFAETTHINMGGLTLNVGATNGGADEIASLVAEALGDCWQNLATNSSLGVRE
ncbi:MAG: hypothetical protein ACRCTY_05640 [Candidatus Adiutrix sp.]